MAKKTLIWHWRRNFIQTPKTPFGEKIDTGGLRQHNERKQEKKENKGGGGRQTMAEMKKKTVDDQKKKKKRRPPGVEKTSALIGLSQGKATQATALRKCRAATLWRVCQHDTGFF